MYKNPICLSNCWANLVLKVYNCITLVFQNPPVIPCEEVFGTPKGLLRRCLGVQISSQEVFWMSSVMDCQEGSVGVLLV